MDANNMDISHCLVTAVRYGRLKTTSKIINTYGLSHSQEWSEGYVLLCLAVENKHTAVAKLLLTSGAKVNSKNTNPCNTPLHFACINGDVEIVKMLLDKGAHVNVENQQGRTPLHNAIENKKMEVTEILLKQRLDFYAQDNCVTNQLYVAVDKKDLQIVEHLLNYGADVNCMCTGTWKKGYTPLHFAVETRSKEVATLLLSRGANVDVKGEDGITPLHIAAEKSYIDDAEDLLNPGSCTKKISKKIVKLLLQHEAKVDDQDKNGQTTLHLAVKRGDLTIVEDVLRYRPDINDQSNRSSLKIAVLGYVEQYKKIVEALLEYGFTVDPEDANNPDLLQVAVKKGYLIIIKDLLKYGADVNTPDKGFTPLHSAAEYKQEEVAKLLVSCGADINAQDQRGNTPILYAIQNADLKMTNLLLTNGASIKDSPDLLNIAVMTECIEIVETLLLHGADVNASDKYGRTALHCTALSEYRVRDINSMGEIAELLLSKGARVDAQTIYGVTTLRAAIVKGCVKVVEILLKYNAKVYSRGKTSGIIPLHLSAHGGNEEITTMLLNKGANVNAKQKDGTTALHIATKKGHKEVVKVLLERGAKVDYKMERGGTPLHLAAEKGYTEIIENILKFGADIDSTDKRGRTALHIATRNGHEEVVVTLLEYGSDINITRRNGRTPLDLTMPERGSHYINFFLSWEVIAVALKRQIVKMKTANLYVSEQNLQSMSRSGEISGFQDECEEEIARMKNEKINNQNLSYYDILAKGTSSLAIYMRNDNIVQVLKSGLYKRKFPIYASMVECLFRKAMESKDLLEQGKQMFHFPKLPYDCTENVFSYLSNEDLRNLINACKPLSISTPNTSIMQ